MYEYVPLDDPGCSLTRILRQPFRGGLAPRRETGTGEYHHGGIGPTCPLTRDRRAGPQAVLQPTVASVIPWEKDLPASGGQVRRVGVITVGPIVRLPVNWPHPALLGRE